MTTVSTLQPTNKMADNDEWTTVTTKKSKPAAAAYVPPSMRGVAAAKAAAEEAKKPLNFQSETLFPSLGVAGHAVKGAWASKTNFKQKVEELIEKDKQTAEEKVIADEERKAMEGWEILEMPKLTAEWGEAWNTYIAALNREERRVAALIDMGLYLEPIVPNKKYKSSAVSRIETFEVDIDVTSSDDEQEQEQEPEEHLSDLD
jgi:hypothetical protein